MKNKKEKQYKFSVALGLTDYINPIFYLFTNIIILSNLNGNIIYYAGFIISILFGFSIPTVKLLVGLGKIKFKLPVNFVFYVNSGIFITGLMLLKNIMNISNLMCLLIFIISIISLILIYKKNKKFNSIAVLIGAIGYMLIYISLIRLAFINLIYISIILYLIAITIYLILIYIGIKCNLKDAKVHWIIELSNITCQGLVLLSTHILFL